MVEILKLENSANISGRKSKGRPKAKTSVPVEVLQSELIVMLSTKIAKEGLSLKAFCERYGVSYSMLGGVLNSNRWVAHSDKETVVKVVANLLQIPVVEVYIKAGLLNHMDFSLEGSLHKKLELAYDAMTQCSKVSACIPKRDVFLSWPLETQTSFVMMYQVIANQQLLELVGPNAIPKQS